MASSSTYAYFHCHYAFQKFPFFCVTLYKDKICRIIIMLPVVVYGCETWSLILRKEHKLRLSENRVLRIFGPKRDEVTGEWGRFHSEQFNDQIMTNTTGGAWSMWRGEGGTYSALVGKPEGNRLLEGPRRRWEDGIKTDLKEIDWDARALAWSGSGNGQVAGYCERGREPWGSVKCGETCWIVEGRLDFQLGLRSVGLGS